MSLSPGTTYYVRVKAVNSDSESDYSDTINVTTLNANITPTPLTASQPVLYKTIPGANSCKIILQNASQYEYIQEYRLTLSVNSDYSAPLYNSFIYSNPLNTNVYIEDSTKYTLITSFNLAANTLYYAEITAVNTVSSSSNLTFSFTTQPNIAPPIAVGVTSLTQITAIANWIKVNGATSYLIDVSTTSTFDTGTLVVNAYNTGDVNSYTIPVLIENTNYWYRVRAILSSTTSINSNIVSFTTLNATATTTALSFNIQPPAIRQKTNITTTAFTLIWSTVDKALSYSIDVSTVPNFSTTVVSISTSLNTYTFTSLSANTLYYVRIKSVNNVNSSTYNITTINTLNGNSSLNPPQLLTPSVVLSTTTVLNWVQRSYAINYVVVLSTASDFSNIILNSYLGNVDTLNLTNLIPSTIYYAQIYGLSASESSTASSTITFTTTALPPAITLNAVTELTDKTAILNWNTNAAYTSYSLSVYKNNFEYLGNGYFNNKPIGNVNNFTLDIFLETNTTYNYFLTGYTSTGDTLNSTTGTLVTKEHAALLQISIDGQYLQWIGNINSIQVSTDSYFRNLLQGYQPKTITSSNNTYKLSNILNSKTNYYIRAYLQTSVTGMYSPAISTINSEPRISNITVTTTTATIEFKLGSSIDYKIQIKQNISGTYTPITGHQFPVSIGNINYYLVASLSSNSQYSVDLFYNNGSGYIQARETAYFNTNTYSNITQPTLNSGYTSPTITLDTVDFDRFFIRFNNLYNLYLIQVSKRSDFLTLENYIETANQYYEYIAESNTHYYVQAVGILSGQSSAVVSADIITSTLPSYPSPLSTAPTITSTTIINQNEATLVYSNISGATGYVIQVSQNSSFTILDNSISSYQLDTNKILLSKLSGIVTYYARMYAYNACSVSAYSSVVTIDTTP